MWNVNIKSHVKRFFNENELFPNQWQNKWFYAPKWRGVFRQTHWKRWELHEKNMYYKNRIIEKNALSEGDF